MGSWGARFTHLPNWSRERSDEPYLDDFNSKGAARRTRPLQGHPYPIYHCRDPDKVPVYSTVLIQISKSNVTPENPRLRLAFPVLSAVGGIGVSL